MNFTQLQLLLQNDELHYLSDDNGSSTSETIEQHTKILKQKPEFILYEYTIHDFDNTRKILRNNNIKHSVYTDKFDMDYIMI